MDPYPCFSLLATLVRVNGFIPEQVIVPDSLFVCVVVVVVVFVVVVVVVVVVSFFLSFLCVCGFLFVK